MPRRLFQAAAAGWMAAALLAAAVYAEDWPTYKADPARSSVTAEGLSFPLAPRWVYVPSQSPRPAWPEPGKELNRTDFDYAPQPVMAGGLVYFGSSADDTVRALDAETGEPVWRFTTEGPVRFAPAIARGKAYVASDDGVLYCLDAKTGKLHWQFRAGPGRDRVIGNGRLIARYPCRTGALVADDVVYVTAGMWPTEGVYVYALDAGTGKELWCNDSSGSIYVDLPHAGASGFSGVAPQGYLVASGQVLLVPTGRSVPAAFDRRTGRLLYYKPEKTHYHAAQYGGGVWCTAAGDLYFNTNNRFQNPSEAHVGEAEPSAQDGMIAYPLATGDQLCHIPGKYRVLVGRDPQDGRDVVYAAGNGSIEAFDLGVLRRKKRVGAGDARWSTPHPERVYCLAMAGGTLLSGNRDCLAAFDAAAGRPVWRVDTKGQQVRGLAFSGGLLVAATYTGEILCFGPAKDAGAQPGRVEEGPRPATISDAQKHTAGDLVRRSGKSEGYALVVGEPDTRLAEALARATRLHVVSLLGDAARILAERDRLLDAGLLGSRVAVHAVEDPASLHLPPYFADLVVVSRAAEGPSPRECYRVLRPCGGAMCFVGFDDAAREEFIRGADIPREEVRRGVVVRGKLPGAGEWRYPWADGGRRGIGSESRVRFPVQVLWFGGPGPGRLVDRHLMGSPPVSTGGRVFMEGQHHVVAFDAYNGRELWSRPVREVGRKYSQYYSSSLVADDDSVYVVQHDKCLRMDQATGRTLFTYAIPESVIQEAGRPDMPDDVERPASANMAGKAKELTPVAAGENPNVPNLRDLDWGYLSVTDDLLLGSYNVPVAAGQPAESHLLKRSESTALFALDKKDGSLRWVYRPRPGRIVANIEIAFGDGRLFLIDGTSKADLARAKRRNREIKAELTLVALSLADGSELWRQDDVPMLGDRAALSRLETNITHLFMGLPNWGHLVYADGVVLYGANAAYDATTGKKLWETNTRPGKLPVVYGDRIITSANAYDLHTGQQCMAEDVLTGQSVPWRYSRAYGCGPVAGCRHLLFFRSGADGFFNMETEGTTNFGGVRSGCARTLLAAGGLLIHPQGYSGCCCSYNYKTNLALIAAPDGGDTWYVFPDRATDGPIKHLAVNFGAPGDRKEARGTAWLGFPRPMLNSACPAPITVSMQWAACTYRRRATAAIENTDVPWVHSSALFGRGRIAIDLVLQPRVVLPRRDTAPNVDGKLDDPCWRDVRAVPFQNSPFSMFGAAIDFRMFRDSENFYFAYRCGSTGDSASDGHSAAGPGDALEIYLADAARGEGILLVIPRDGQPTATFGTVGTSRRVDPNWKGRWHSAVQKTTDGWAGEVALPVKTVTKSGMDLSRLQLNAMAQGRTPSGPQVVFLTDPRYGTKFTSCVGFRRIAGDPAEPPERRSFTVRLHFAEIEDVRPGQRVFDVTVQGETVLKSLDIAGEAGGKNRALVKEFRHVEATQQIVIELRPTGRPGRADAPPLISGIEVVQKQ